MSLSDKITDEVTLTKSNVIYAKDVLEAVKELKARLIYHEIMYERIINKIFNEIFGEKLI